MKWSAFYSLKTILVLEAMLRTMFTGAEVRPGTLHGQEFDGAYRYTLISESNPSILFAVGHSRFQRLKLCARRL